MKDKLMIYMYFFVILAIIILSAKYAKDLSYSLWYEPLVIETINGY